MIWMIAIVVLIMWTPVLLSPKQRGRARIAELGKNTNRLLLQSPGGPKGPHEDMITTTSHDQYCYIPRAVPRELAATFRQAEVFDAISFQSTRGGMSFFTYPRSVSRNKLSRMEW